MNWRIRVLQTRALPLGYGTMYKNRNANAFLFYFVGAGDEARTRYLHLGKVALYRMSYTRIFADRRNRISSIPEQSVLVQSCAQLGSPGPRGPT